MGGYKQTDPTCYIVDWPESGVFKIGFSTRQRWRKFVLRGANIVALHPVPNSTGAFDLEAYFEDYATVLYAQAFRDKSDEAKELLGSDADGYLECHRGDGHEFYDLMLKHCAASIARLEASNRSRAMPRTYARTDGLTQMASHLPADTSPSVTRTRTYRIFPNSETT